MSSAISQSDPQVVPAINGWLRERFKNGTRPLLELFDRYVGRRRSNRSLSLLVVYALILWLVFNLAYELRWDFVLPEEDKRQCASLIIAVVLCKLILLHSYGQFRSVLSYFGLADFGGVVCSMSAVSGLMLILWLAATANAAPPRGVILMDFVLSVSLVSAFRLSLRVVRSWSMSGNLNSGVEERRVVIIGAGDVGEALAKDLLSRNGNGLHPVFFVDDDPVKIGRSVHGLPVYGPLETLLKLGVSARVNELVITMTAPPTKQVKEIVELGRKIGATTQIVPSFTQ